MLPGGGHAISVTEAFALADDAFHVDDVEEARPDRADAATER